MKRPGEAGAPATELGRGSRTLLDLPPRGSSFLFELPDTVRCRALTAGQDGSLAVTSEFAP